MISAATSTTVRIVASSASNNNNNKVRGIIDTCVREKIVFFPFLDNFFPIARIFFSVWGSLSLFLSLSFKSERRGCALLALSLHTYRLFFSLSVLLCSLGRASLRERESITRARDSFFCVQSFPPYLWENPKLLF